MSVQRELSESAVVSALADAVRDRVTQQVIRHLQTLSSGGLSGEDSGLKGVWDEICVQVQYEQSVYWDDYEALARSSVAHHVAELAQHEREALWLQTDEGSDWLYEERFRLRESIRREVCLEFDLLIQLPIWTEDHSGARGDRHDGYPVIYDDVVSYLLDRVLSQAADWTNKRIRAYIDRRYEYD